MFFNLAIYLYPGLTVRYCPRERKAPKRCAKFKFTFHELKFIGTVHCINCSDTGNSFKCHDTDLLISLIKPHFDISESDLKDEITNEKWACKKCGSTYEYGWSDFSIYVERQKLKLTELKTEVKGLPTKKPIPLFLGLAGHSYPSTQEITSVSFAEFKMYMSEQ